MDQSSILQARQPPQAPQAPDLHARCRTLSLSDIPHNGYVLFENSEDFTRAGDMIIAGEFGECSLCSMLLWSLGSQLRVRQMNDSCVILYVNHPKEFPLQRLEIIVVRKAYRERLGWGFDVRDRWYIGPPDPKPWLARGHLMLYAAQGKYMWKLIQR